MQSHVAEATRPPGPSPAAENAADCPENTTEAPFGLLWVRYNLPFPCNHGAFGVKLRQVVCGNIQLALISNYMIDLRWLLSACPDLSGAQKLLIVHGMDPPAMYEQMQQVTPQLASKVRVPIHMHGMAALCALVPQPLRAHPWDIHMHGVAALCALVPQPLRAHACDAGFVQV
jgi:hypothetical protein